MRDYINKIKDETIRNKVTEVYMQLPDYFEEVAASSTGKYHPRFSLGKGGLLRHTKCAVEYALSLFPLYEFSERARDVIIASLILHDGLKHGHEKSMYTVKNHAEIMADWLKELWGKEPFPFCNDIIDCIETHMGQWSIRRRPQTETEHFVHLCDYLASRKFLDNFYPEVTE